MFVNKAFMQILSGFWKIELSNSNSVIVYLNKNVPIEGTDTKITLKVVNDINLFQESKGKEGFSKREFDTKDILESNKVKDLYF